MREIKFRGKTKNGDWVYGSYQADVMKIDKHTIIYADKECFYCEDEVKQSTVGEYTGFKDKNGTEIYEGDIIESIYGKCRHNPEGLSRLGFVLYDTKTAAFKMKVKNSAVLVGFYDINKCEVIGNIYENPELLK